MQLGLDIDGEAAGDLSGWSVSMNANGDSVAIGSFKNNGNGIDAGHLRVFNFICNTSESDTSFYHVSDSSFQSNSPQTYYISTDTFTGTHYPYCDSIVTSYGSYVYHPSYCTDTLTDTIDVFDTTYVSISVTDTLYIDILITGINNVNNTIKVYPNPANDIVVIDNGNYGAMSNYSISITNSLSQQVYSSLINTTQLQIPVSTLGSVGTYFIQILDGNNSVVETKQLILH